MSEKVEEAVDLFERGLNCSQAICATYGPQFGIDKTTALKVACGFGGGMRMAETCGAVTGALMVLGLKYGPANTEDKDGKPATYEQVRQYTETFEACNGSVVCRDLLACDITTPEGMQNADDKGLFNSICPEMVRSAAEILEEMIGQ